MGNGRLSKMVARIGVVVAVVVGMIGMAQPHVAHAEAPIVATPTPVAGAALDGGTISVTTGGATTNATVPVYFQTLACPSTVTVPAWSTLEDYGIAVRENGGTYVRWWYGKNAAGAYVDVRIASTWYANKVACG